MTTFPEVFKAAARYDLYPYQVEFSTCKNLHSLVSVPTGCGACAARQGGDGD